MVVTLLYLGMGISLFYMLFMGSSEEGAELSNRIGRLVSVISVEPPYLAQF